MDENLEKQLYGESLNLDIYRLAEREGVFDATLDLKRWGRKQNMLAYFTFADGDKIMASAWQDTGYLGIPDIRVGTAVRLTFRRAGSGKIYLRGVDGETQGDGLSHAVTSRELVRQVPTQDQPAC